MSPQASAQQVAVEGVKLPEGATRTYNSSSEALGEVRERRQGEAPGGRSDVDLLVRPWSRAQVPGFFLRHREEASVAGRMSSRSFASGTDSSAPGGSCPPGAARYRAARAEVVCSVMTAKAWSSRMITAGMPRAAWRTLSNARFDHFFVRRVRRDEPHAAEAIPVERFHQRPSGEPAETGREPIDARKCGERIVHCR